MQQFGKRIISGVLAAALVLPSFGLAGGSSDRLFGADLAVTAYADSVYVGQPTVSESYTATSSSVKISWKKVSGVSGYRVYRMNNTTRKYEKIKTLYGDGTLSYKDTGLSASTRYSYKVKAFTKFGGSTCWGKASSPVYTCTISSAAPVIKSVTAYGSGIRLSWGKVACSGYEIYGYSYYTGKWTLLKKPSASSTSCTLYLDSYEYGGLSGYQFRIKSYTKDAAGGVKRTKSTTAETYYDASVISAAMSEGISRLNSAPRQSRSTYIMYNTQGSKTTKTTQYLTGADRAAIEKFAAEHFKSGWTPAQKAAYTLNWINKNVEYASGSSYYAISGMGYAEAIFGHGMGQCLQYNGAMVEMLIYLGYDASLIWGYRGTSDSNKWQHFWGEVNIGGKPYVIETGNYAQSGDWWYLCTPYGEASKYIKNGKVLTK